MLISFETACEVLTGWMGERMLWRHGVVVFSGNAPSTFTCPLVLGTLNEDGSSNMTCTRLIKIIGWVFLYLPKNIPENNVIHLHGSPPKYRLLNTTTAVLTLQQWCNPDTEGFLTPIYVTIHKNNKLRIVL